MSDGPTPTDESKPRRSRFPIWARVILFGFLYVYSIGPMFWLWYEAEIMGGSPLLRAFYFPLQLLCEGSSSFESFLNRYINWWIV